MSDKETVCAVLLVLIVVGSIIALMGFLQYTVDQHIISVEEQANILIDNIGTSLKMKHFRYPLVDQNEWENYVDNLVILAKYGTTKKDQDRLFIEKRDFFIYETEKYPTKILKNKMIVVENQVKRLEESK